MSLLSSLNTLLGAHKYSQLMANRQFAEGIQLSMELIEEFEQKIQSLLLEENNSDKKLAYKEILKLLR